MAGFFCIYMIVIQRILFCYY